MNRPVEVRKQACLMGSAFEFVLVTDERSGHALLEECVAEVKRIEDLLTEFSDTSQTARLNKAAGIEPVRVDAEVYALLKRCHQLSRITQGAFDITASILKKLYNFKHEYFIMPGREKIRAALGRIGYEKIKFLDGNRIFLSEPGMHIGFGAIGKGYAADRVKQLMMARGVKGGVINASGDLAAWGSRLDAKPWTIGIADPENPGRALMRIPLVNAAVATSGDYERFFELKGKRYSHTIDPTSGKPVRGVKSVTVVSRRAELSDALATAVFIMGPATGMHLIEQLPGLHALLITEENEVMITSHLKPQRNEQAA
jgi:thiamine biosynthesis lipoprotein